MLSDREKVSHRAVMRFVVGLLMAVVVSVGACVSPALSEPGSPAAPEDILAKYKRLNREAEQANEALLNAQSAYNTTHAHELKAAADLKAANTHLAELDKRFAPIQRSVDELVRSSYEGARVSRMFAILVSDSPQQAIDQMSLLDRLSKDAAAKVAVYKKARQKIDAARTAANSALVKSSAAAKKAYDAQQVVLRKKNGLDIEIAQVGALYRSLTGQQLKELAGPTVHFDPKTIAAGTSPQRGAVLAALSRVGDPYVWGATGPTQFDCSGLMMWAYKQVGITIPRSSQAQEAGGTPVRRDQLQPGDLVIIYPDASHVAMYVGNGYVIHASTFGVPVKVVPLDDAGPMKDARRY